MAGSDTAGARARQLIGQFGTVWPPPHRMQACRSLRSTDLGDPYVIPGFALQGELALMVAAGVTTLAALQSATSEPARAFGLDTAGSIAAGQDADLLLLDADPLADIAGTRRIYAVVLNGRWLPHQ